MIETVMFCVEFFVERCKRPFATSKSNSPSLDATSIRMLIGPLFEPLSILVAVVTVM